MFRDREDAGQQLLERLSALELDNLVILALPRGGLPVADVIAEGLDASLDIVLVRKVGCPGHRELAVGAVTNGSDPLLTVNEEVALALGLDHERIRALAEPELETIRQRRQLYLKGRPSVPLAGKTVVVVDDGIATGATMRAALSRIRQAKPARLLAAVPVASPKALEALARDCDDIICIDAPRWFQAVGLHYQVFDQVKDATVMAILERNAKRRARVMTQGRHRQAAVQISGCVAGTGGTEIS